MASCQPVGCLHMGELAVAVWENKKILPKPHWCQESAMIAFIVDALKERIKELENDQC